MKKAVLGITKYVGQFIGDKGDTVKYQYLEIEFAPNCFTKFKLNEANLRCLEKYNPDMYQLVVNIPEGHLVQFEQIPKTTNGIGEIYSFSKEDNEL